MKKMYKRKYTRREIKESLILISQFQENKKKCNDRLKKSLDKNTCRIYQRLKKDLKKYNNDACLYYLIKRLPSTIWLHEYIYPVIFFILFVGLYSVTYQICVHFYPEFIIYSSERSLVFKSYITSIAYPLAILIWKLRNKKKKRIDLIYDIQKVLEKIIK